MTSFSACIVKPFFLCCCSLPLSFNLFSQDSAAVISPVLENPGVWKAFYGQASYYASKFNGRRTASGELFSQEKYTAACNVLPLGTKVKVTNLSNGKWVLVKTNDRLHPKMRRLIDLSRIAAQKLGYIQHGLTRVKVEVVHP